MEYKLNTKPPSLAALILCISFPSVVAVLLTPALPAIAKAMHISGDKVQQLITLFVIGYALGQLIYAPFANRFGRKVALYSGISLYLLGSLICLLGVFTASIYILFIGRFLAALGSSVGMVICFTIINDFYYPEQARTIASYTVLAYAFMPAMGVLFGGFITSNFSWVGCFYFYIIYGIAILFVAKTLPETLAEKNHHALHIVKILKSYYQAFTNLRLVLFSALFGLFGSFAYVIASGGPFIGVTKIGLTPAAYGLMMLIAYSGQFIGSLISGRASKFVLAYTVIFWGASATFTGVIILSICFKLGIVNNYSFFGSLFLVMLGLPMIYSSASTMATSHCADKATASSIMSFITMMIAFTSTMVVAILPTKNIMEMPHIFMGLVVIIIVVLVLSRKV
jgi:DHA1 family bicyclomycin/chloramphenicol resistance-like MFS transporter